MTKHKKIGRPNFPKMNFDFGNVQVQQIIGPGTCAVYQAMVISADLTDLAQSLCVFSFSE